MPAKNATPEIRAAHCVNGRYWTRIIAENSENTTHADAHAADAMQLAAKDDRFRAVIDAGPVLPESVRSEIFAIIQTPAT